MSIRFAVDGGKLRVWSVNQGADAAELMLDLLRRHPSAGLVFLPAEGAALPQPKAGHSAICQCAVKRGPVRFQCIALDQAIAGERFAVAAENDPEWKAPVTGRPHKQKQGTSKEPAEPRATKVDVASLILELRSEGLLAGEIAQALNARGLLRGDGMPFTDHTIRRKLQALEYPALQARPEAKPRPVSVLAPIEAVNALAEVSMIAAMIEGLRECLLAA